MQSLADQADQARVDRSYLRSAQLYLAVAEQGGPAPRALYSAACGFALAGRTEEAYSALERAVSAGLGQDKSADHAQADPDLASLHGDARWRPLMGRLAADHAASEKQRRAFWDGPAMQTPYAENLSDDEKVAGLSKLWAEAKFNFIFFDKLPTLNWDAVYMAYLPKVRATRSTFEYYRLLQEMLALLEDGHTGVWMSWELEEQMAARPLVRTRLVEGKVMVIAVDESLAATGLAPGMEIVDIDGVTAIDHATRHVMPYQGASTPQDRAMRTYGDALLMGPKAQPVQLTVRDAEGKVSVRVVPRASNAAYWKMVSPEPMSFKMLPGKVAYVALNSFADAQAADRFEAAFPEIAKAEAMVIDMRENGGGSGVVGLRVLATLTEQPLFTAPWETRDYQPSARAWGRKEARFKSPASPYPPNGKLLFTKPVIVLTSPRTYSAAEDFTAAFRTMKRGQLVGEVTGGSTGMALNFPLPGGGGARVCTKHDTYPDGTEYVGVGIVPDVVVSPTIADLRNHRDRVLEAALEQLAKQ